MATPKRTDRPPDESARVCVEFARTCSRRSSTRCPTSATSAVVRSADTQPRVSRRGSAPRCWSNALSGLRVPACACVPVLTYLQGESRVDPPGERERVQSCVVLREQAGRNFASCARANAQ